MLLNFYLGFIIIKISYHHTFLQILKLHKEFMNNYIITSDFFLKEKANIPYKKEKNTKYTLKLLKVTL